MIMEKKPTAPECANIHEQDACSNSKINIDIDELKNKGQRKSSAYSVSCIINCDDLLCIDLFKLLMIHPRTI